MPSSSSAPRFTGFSITTRDRSSSLAFWRALGFDVEEDKHGGGRSCVDTPNQHFDVDDADAVPNWNCGSRGAGIVLGFEVDQRERVDEVVASLVALGYPVQQPPYDAPWGRRYGVVEDADGNAISFMSSS